MDTVILVLSAAAVFTIGYGFVWTVRAVRRVGVRRFAAALGALVWAVVKVCLKLFQPSPYAIRKNVSSGDDALNSIISGDEISSGGTSERSGPGFHFNHSTGSFDDGLDPDGIYFTHDKPS